MRPSGRQWDVTGVGGDSNELQGPFKANTLCCLLTSLRWSEPVPGSSERICNEFAYCFGEIKFICKYPIGIIWRVHTRTSINIVFNSLLLDIDPSLESTFDLLYCFDLPVTLHILNHYKVKYIVICFTEIKLFVICSALQGPVLFIHFKHTMFTVRS